MRKYILLLALAVSVAAGAKTVTLTRAQLADKIRGGWAGKTIACTYGGPTEFKYGGKIIPDEKKIAWDETRCKWYYDKAPGLYDDVYMDLTFVEVMDSLGLDAPTEAFEQAFAYAEYPLWHANQSARYNILQGVKDPGHWRNNPHADDIDFQIEADYAGLMAPGMPVAACHYADKPGHIMCYGDGWYGGVYVAAMYSLAFVSSDVNYVVEEALKTIPEKSLYYQCMADVIQWYKQNPTDWKKTWQLVEDKWASKENCPGMIFGKGSIDAKINSAYVVMGLLYGQGDYTRTIDISTRCGQDSDCNPSTAAGILGVMTGYEAIPDYWKNPVKPVMDRDFVYTDISINRATELSVKQALQVISLNGGKVSEKSVKIRLQQPTAVRYEKSFDGMVAYQRKGVHRPIDKVGTIRFHGCGIVLTGELTADDKNYVGLVDIYIDGKKQKRMELPASRHARSNDIYWNFDLAEGDHVLTLKRINPQDNVKSQVGTYIVYKKAE